jgi:membrane protease YdiL (CAAX protease family)
VGSGRGFAVSAAILAAASVAGIWLPGWAYLPLNLALAIGLLWVARRSGAGPDDLGTRASTLRRGLAFGAVLGLAAAALIAAAAAIPATRGWFEDERAGGIGVAGLLYQVVLRIPVGTALFEEVAFRGVLLGLGRRAWGRRAGAWASAVLFGLWHLAPAGAVADANTTAAGVPLPVVLALAVVSTTAAGLVLTSVRDRAGSLAAPAALHAAVNAAAFTAAWLAF